MTDTDDKPKTPRLLALLEDELLPAARGRRAYRTPPKLPQTLLDAVQTPGWNWTFQGPGAKELFAQELVKVDASAAYLSAASSVDIARDQLNHTGPVDTYRRHPGYYRLQLTRRDPWDDARLMSPLGTGTYQSHVWLAEPTVTLLEQLAKEDDWPEVVITDSWTTPEKARLTSWTDHLRALRLDLIDEGDDEAYERFKLAYAKAVQMVQGHELCTIRRPDWYHAIHAQHRATMWRKLWRAVEAGVGPVRCAAIDAAEFTDAAYQFILTMDKPPLRIDNTGRSFGSFKVDDD